MSKGSSKSRTLMREIGVIQRRLCRRQRLARCDV